MKPARSEVTKIACLYIYAHTHLQLLLSVQELMKMLHHLYETLTFSSLAGYTFPRLLAHV